MNTNSGVLLVGSYPGTLVFLDLPRRDGMGIWVLFTLQKFALLFRS